MNSTDRHAVVISSSMARLLAARVLSQYFDRVTVIERDRVDNQPLARKGQPQARHLHVLLAQGFQILTRFFPDLPQALSDGGAVLVDMAEHMLCQPSVSGMDHPPARGGIAECEPAFRMDS